jgi:hypothetical protein
MGVAIGFDPQDCMALVAGRTGDIAQRLLAAQPDAQGLSRFQALQTQFGTHEGHGADLTGNVDVMVCLYRLVGHVPNYTANSGQCRVCRHA